MTHCSLSWKRSNPGRMSKADWAPPRFLDGSDPSWPLERLRALAYIVGVVLKGDGSVYKVKRVNRKGEPAGYNGEVALRVSAPEFARYFCRRCAVMLGRRPTKVQGPYSDHCYVAKFRAIVFYRWWSSIRASQIKRIARTFPHEYLKGRFDSEAGVGSYCVYMFGAADHRWVLALDNQLCRLIGMRTGPILPYGKAGAKSYIYGREVISKVQKLRFTVNSTDFIKRLGRLAVDTRNRKLHDMVKGRRWTPWSAAIRRKAMSLVRDGLSPADVSTEIRRHLGVHVPPMTIYYWGKGTRSWAGYSATTRPNS